MDHFQTGAEAAAESEDERWAIANVLSRLGVRDHRVLAILLKTLEDDVELGAGSLAEYGDPAALPHLGAALDRCELDVRGGLLANQDIICRLRRSSSARDPVRLFPRKVSCEATVAREIVHSLRAFWTYARDALAHPHAVACLAELGDEAIPRLANELEDPSNFGMQSRSS